MKAIYYFIFLIWSANAFGQQCGTDVVNNEILKNNLAAAKEKAAMDAYTKAFVAQYYKDMSSMKKGSRAAKYIVPVVFHILHDGGVENYSDADVNEAVVVINEYYNAGNTAELNTVVNEFKNKIGKIEVEFRLARKTPAGKATNGINHYYTTATNVGLEHSKINNWPRDKYLNIWVVKAVKQDATKFGTLAYSMYPSSVKEIINNVTGDGVITKVLPTKKTLTGAGVLAHEIGHFLNLSHTWGSTNEPGKDCGDDEVDDTPETMGTQGGCDLGMNICHPGIIENTQNIMNYSDCSIMFTEGQKIRMIAALNSPIADRNKLWTASNLLATGVEPPASLDCAPIAEFGTPQRMVCLGKPVTFYNYTYNTPVYTSQWTFDKTEVITPSTEKSPTVTYNTPGWKTITLVTTNDYGTSTVSKEMIFVTEVNEAINAPFFESFEHYTVLSKWTAINYNLNNTQFSQVTSTGSLLF
jgi:hypothetical protein